MTSYATFSVLKSMTVRDMLGMFRASQVGRHSINRHVAGDAGGGGRHGNAVSSGCITMINPLSEAQQGRGGVVSKAHGVLGKTTVLVSYAG